ncbi:hypothetical protein BBJ28_00015269 [Nothophytophthora sp. Chile5]|nr:hypothetical protein BBJ28_00015269 [Nothophytophthora sp. Chile5]
MATPLPAAAADTVRVYVGGLPADVTTTELRERFGRFVGSPDSRCELQGVTLLPVKGGVCSASQRHRGFAYLTLRGANAAALAAQLEKTYHRTKWRGSVLRVEPAKPSYLAKLQAEWQEARRLEEQAVNVRTAALETLQPAEVKPLKLATPFAGRRRTQFDLEDALSAEIQELEELEEQQQETDTEASGDEQGASTDEQEASSDEEEASGDEEGALTALADGEDDVEAFVRQVEAEEAAAQALEVKSEAREREEANAKRLAALAAKQQRKQQQSAVALAVGSNKKITFDDSGNEQEPEEQQEEEEEEPAAAIANWMDSSDDEAETEGQKTFEFAGEEGAEDADASAFALRPEFLGARGKKLFELQKRFGGDSRFRLDARFLEEEADEFGGNDVEEDGEEPAEPDELQTFLEEEDAREAAQQAQEMREEEAQALRVVALLYPDVDVARLQRRSAKPKDPLKEAAWMGQLQRYDPRDAHARRDFELAMTSTTSLGGGESAEDAAAVPRREEKPPPTGGDRFFATSGSLGSLFSRVRTNSEDGEEGDAALDGVVGLGGHAEQQEDAGGPFKLSSLFAFSLGEEKPLAALGEQLLEEEEDTAEGHVSSSVHQDVLEPELVATDSEHDVDEEEEAPATPTPTRPHKTRAKKSLQDFLAFGRSFRGPEDASADVDASAWPERRKKLTLDYKRKRRDALKSKKRQHKATTTTQRGSEPKKPRV